MPDTLKSKLKGIVVACCFACLLSGCSDSESGTKTFVPPTPAQVQQYQAAQIKSIQDNPNIPPGQKASIIAMYQGPDRTAMQPAQSTAGSK